MYNEVEELVASLTFFLLHALKCDLHMQAVPCVGLGCCQFDMSVFTKDYVVVISSQNLE